tara:strand:+ start:105 stop:827 length:723 start_codon:yes stop_codon:yes gene_type:complete
MIIAIETSSTNFSISLLHEEHTINNITVPFKNELSEIIVPTIKRFLKDNSIFFKDVSFIAVGCGPGSFTGIRSVVSVALGIKISNNHIRSIGINSLAGLAISVLDEAKKLNIKYILSSIDSKRGDLFLQLFKLNCAKVETLPFDIVNDIETINIENLPEYISINKITPKDILFVGYQSKLAKNLVKDIKIAKKFNQKPNSLDVAKLASIIIKNNVETNTPIFIFDKIKPIYARSAQINLI